LKKTVVSVILPFYNAESTIESAIRSISKQTFAFYECILIDNNSIDKSPEIAEKLTKADPRFKLVKEKRQGVVHASNKGSLEAKGKYIARMDADDEAHPQRLEKQLKFLEANPQFDAVASRAEYIPHQQNTLGFQNYVEWSNHLLSNEDILLNRFVEMPVINPTMMWKANSAKKFGLYHKGDFPEDYELWLRWLDKGAKIAKLPEVLVKWYDSAERLTRTSPVYSPEAFYKIKAKYLYQWLERNNPFHPEILVWGASRISRKRVEMLEKHGVKVKAFIETNTTRQTGRKIIHYKEIPPPSVAFIVTYITHKDIREKIREFLHKNGFNEGAHFLVAS
jgi:glycosyltransferase involved in cell wall biosynthesis